MIWDTSIWRLGCSNHSKIRSAQKCYPCLRYVVSPMSPGRTLEVWRRRRDSNPRDPFESNGFQDRRIQPLCHSSGLIIQQFTKAPLYILEILRPSAEDTSLSGRRVLKPQITEIGRAHV